jgi:hypothetical protein
VFLVHYAIEAIVGHIVAVVVEAVALLVRRQARTPRAFDARLRTGGTAVGVAIPRLITLAVLVMSHGPVAALGRAIVGARRSGLVVCTTPITAGRDAVLRAVAGILEDLTPTVATQDHFLVGVGITISVVVGLRIAVGIALDVSVEVGVGVTVGADIGIDLGVVVGVGIAIGIAIAWGGHAVPVLAAGARRAAVVVGVALHAVAHDQGAGARGGQGEQ